MIKTFMTSVALLCVQTLLAEEIQSRVIHNYSQIGVSYGYLHDIGNSDVNANGVLGDYSFDYRNVIFHVNGGAFWGDDDLGINADVELWTIAGGVGYVFRFYENHINVIPRFEVGYSEISVKVPGFGTSRDHSTAILPGVTLSYALNNRISVDGGYTYSRDVDNGDDGHGFTVGTHVALLEQLGLNVQAAFAEGRGFTGITAGFSFHY
jgi:hypothetical protein